MLVNLRYWLIRVALLLLIPGVAFCQPAPPPVRAPNPFSDVKPGDPAYEEINRLSREGIIEGFPDGQFKGRKIVTRYEMAKIVARLLARVTALKSAGAKITPEQALVVTRLTNEFRTELDLLGVRVESVEKRVDRVEQRTNSLEAALSNIRLEGFYRLENTFVFQPFNSYAAPGQFHFANYPFDITKNPFTQFTTPGLQALQQLAFLRFFGTPYIGGALVKTVETFVELQALITGPSGGNPILQYQFSNPPISGDSFNDIATGVNDPQRVQVSKAHFKTFARNATFRAFSNESMQDLTDPAVLLTADAFDVPPFSGLEVNGNIFKMSYFASALKVEALDPPLPNGNDPTNLTNLFKPITTNQNDIFSFRMIYEPYRYRRNLPGRGPTQVIFGTSYVEKIYSYDKRNNFNRVIAADATVSHTGKDEKFDLTLEPEWSFGIGPDFAAGGPLEEVGVPNQDISGQAFRLDTNYQYKKFLANFKFYTFSHNFRVNMGARQFIDYNLPPYRTNFGRSNNPDDPFNPAETLARLNLKWDLENRVITPVRKLTLSVLGEAKKFAREPLDPQPNDRLVAKRWNVQLLADFNDKTHVEALHEEQYPIPPVISPDIPIAGQKAIQDSKLTVDFKATKKTSFIGELEIIDDGNRASIGPDGKNYSYQRARFQVNSQVNRRLFLSGYAEQTNNALQRVFTDGNGNVIRPLVFNARRILPIQRNGLDITILEGESNLQLFDNKVALKNYILHESDTDNFNLALDGHTDVLAAELVFNFNPRLRARYQYALNDQYLKNRKSIWFANNFGELVYTPTQKTELRLTYGYEYENADDRFDNGPYLFYRTIKILQLKAQTDF